MVKKNKEKTPKQGETSSGGSIKKFFSKFIKRKNKGEEKESHEPETGNQTASTDVHSSPHQVTPMRTNAPLVNREIHRRRTFSEDRSTVSRFQHLRRNTSEHSINSSSSAENTSRPLSAHNAQFPSFKAEFVEKLKNLSKGPRHSRSRRRQFPTSSDSNVSPTSPLYSVPPSPACSDSICIARPTISATSSEQSLGQMFHNAGDLDSSTSESNNNLSKRELRARRRQRQKYHAAKQSQETIFDPISPSSQENTEVENIASDPAPIASREINMVTRCVRTKSPIRSSPVTPLRINMPNTILTSENEDSYSTTSSAGRRYVKPTTPVQSKIVTLDNIGSVSLEGSISPVSTIERRQKFNITGIDNDTEDKTIDSTSASNQVIHYHLTIQNCEGINIYVNNPDSENITPRTIQTEDGGLLRRLSWVQGADVDKIQGDTVPPISVVPQNNDVAIAQSEESSSPDVSGNKYSNAEPFGNTNQNHQNVDNGSSTSTESHLAYTAVNRSNCDNQEHTPSSQTSMSQKGEMFRFPWHKKKSNPNQNSDVPNNKQKSSSAARYKTFSKSSQFKGPTGGSTTSEHERETAKSTFSDDSQTQTEQETSQDPPIAKCRPVAHIRPVQRQSPQTVTSSTSASIFPSTSNVIPSRPTQAFTHQPRRALNQANLILSQQLFSEYNSVNLQNITGTQLTSSSVSVMSSPSISSLNTEALIEADASGGISSENSDESDDESTIGDYSSDTSSVIDLSMPEVPNLWDDPPESGQGYPTQRTSAVPQEVSRGPRSNNQTFTAIGSGDNQRVSRQSILPQQSASEERVRSASAERRSGHNATQGTTAREETTNLPFRRHQSMRDGEMRNGQYVGLPIRYQGLRRELARVPGVLIVSYQHNNLLVYLSRTRPNVEGVVRFMMSHGIPQGEYSCQVMPGHYNQMNTVPNATSAGAS